MTRSKQQQQQQSYFLSHCCWLVLGFLFLIQSTNAQYSQHTLLWSDEFNDDTLDTNVWSYDLGNGGWGNHELQTYTNFPENCKVENGLLQITARRTTLDPAQGSSNSEYITTARNADHDNTVFTSARIKSENAVSFQYGVIEARIRVPQMDAGLWPAFWTMGEGM